MRINYDPEQDVLKIILTDVPVSRCDHEKPGIILGYGGDGSLANMEIHEASQRIDNPRRVDIALRGQCVQGMQLCGQ